VQISREQETGIHRAACRWVAVTASGRVREVESIALGESAETVPGGPLTGLFVTLRREGQLRGCYGTFGGRGSADPGAWLKNAAVGAAMHDPRFSALTADEVPNLLVEVSLLHSTRLIPPPPSARPEAITIGRHGLDITRGRNRGLLLPRVAIDLRLDAQGFLNQVCLKAEMESDAWLSDDTELHTFEAHCFGGPWIGE
jgi:hypothetical protein